MEQIFIPMVALVASLLTFFSGFGLGTLLLPAFAAFFPASLAVAATAIVHLANNALKFALTARHIDRRVLLHFGVPAILAGIVGAWLLTRLGEFTPLITYQFAAHSHDITLLKIVIGALMIGFAALELMPAFASWKADEKWLPAGGVLSGFFGGLSGHQGAFRSLFLARAGLTSAQFIATGVAVAVAIDIVRLGIYVPGLRWGDILLANSARGRLLLLSGCAALLGTWIGARFLHKTTISSIRIVVAILLILLGSALGTGLI